MWNVGEIVGALGLTLLGYLCLHVSWIYGVLVLALVLAFMTGCLMLVVKGWRRLTRMQPV